MIPEGDFCGLFGRPPLRSPSPRIHARFGIRDYSLFPVSREEFFALVSSPRLRFANVTMPYKRDAIDFLSVSDPEVVRTSSCNAIVRRNGLLFGYNTDVCGLIAGLERAEIEVEGRDALILGTGATSRTAARVCEILGAKSTRRAGRNSGLRKDGACDFSDAEIIIDATPVGGTFCEPGRMLVDPRRFPKLKGYFDCVYDPIETVSASTAKSLGVPASGGLFMLVEQARKSAELFLDREIPKEASEKIYAEISSDLSAFF